MSNKHIDFYHNIHYWFKYVSACEATWRILAFLTYYRTPAVEKLCFHIPNQKIHIHDESKLLKNIFQRKSVSVVLVFRYGLKRVRFIQNQGT